MDEDGESSVEVEQILPEVGASILDKDGERIGRF